MREGERTKRERERESETRELNFNQSKRFLNDQIQFDFTNTHKNSSALTQSHTISLIFSFERNSLARAKQKHETKQSHSSVDTYFINKKTTYTLMLRNKY